MILSTTSIPIERLLNEVKVAAILDEPTSKKDVDFTRGFLLAIDGEELPL